MPSFRLGGEPGRRPAKPGAYGRYVSCAGGVTTGMGRLARPHAAGLFDSQQEVLRRKDVGMRYGLYRDARIVTSTLLLAAAVLFVATSLRAAPLDRLSADFQNQGERATSTLPEAGGAGGVVVYSKTVEVPKGEEVIYITFSGQADVHPMALPHERQRQHPVARKGSARCSEGISALRRRRTVGSRC